MRIRYEGRRIIITPEAGEQIELAAAQSAPPEAPALPGREGAAALSAALVLAKRVRHTLHNMLHKKARKVAERVTTEDVTAWVDAHYEEIDAFAASKGISNNVAAIRFWARRLGQDPQALYREVISIRRQGERQERAEQLAEEEAVIDRGATLDAFRARGGGFQGRLQ